MNQSTLLQLSCLLAVALFAHAQQDNKYRLKGDYLDVPVKAGYRIMGNDGDGYLEDGIIVKTKGTGYIDPRYRKRYDNGQLVGQQTGQQLSPQASYQKVFYAQPKSSQFMYPSPSKYASAVPEIIYGRREW